MNKSIPKLFSTICCCILSLLIFSASLWAGRTVPVIPVQGKPISITLNGDEKTYYALSKKIPVILEIDGPGKLTTLSRLSLSKDTGSPESYSIIVKERSNIVKTYTTATEKSEATFKDRLRIPGKMRKFTVSIPEGTHRYEFFLANTSLTEAAVKFNFQLSTSFGKLITLEPLSYDKVVTAISGEKLIAYYVSSKEHQVQLRVLGPTRLKVTSRLNYHAEMKGNQKYTITMLEGEHQVVMKPLSTTKAIAITYQEWKDVVPGKDVSFFFDVPKGEHRYRFALNESLAQSVSLKFSIPQKDLKNEN